MPLTPRVVPLHVALVNNDRYALREDVIKSLMDELHLSEDEANNLVNRAVWAHIVDIVDGGETIIIPERIENNATINSTEVWMYGSDLPKLDNTNSDPFKDLLLRYINE